MESYFIYPRVCVGWITRNKTYRQNIVLLTVFRYIFRKYQPSCKAFPQQPCHKAKTTLLNENELHDFFSFPYCNWILNLTKRKLQEGQSDNFPFLSGCRIFPVSLLAKVGHQQENAAARNERPRHSAHDDILRRPNYIQLVTEWKYGWLHARHLRDLKKWFKTRHFRTVINGYFEGFVIP